MSLEKKDAILFGDGDELPSNHLNSPHMDDLAAGLGRRQILVDGAVLGVLAFLGAALSAGTAPAETQAPAAEGLRGLPFKRRNRLPLEAIAGGRTDTIRASVGYKATLFIPWGTPISGGYLGLLDNASNSAQDQAEQIGMHHDGMHFFPIDAQFGFGGGHISNHDLLALNHEYIGAPLLRTNGPTVVDGKRIVAGEVRKEINAHGVSIVEIRRNVRSEWNVVSSQCNRRTTAAIPMRTVGPARGHELLRTRHNPDGIHTRGTHNNCSNGFTPWGTYPICEENWVSYFSTRDSGLPRESTRYGIRNASRFGWETLVGDEFEHSDATRKGKQAQDDYRDKPNNFGWIVEIDPFGPQSVPVRCTALGRFAHEDLVFAPVKPGRQVVCYSGDGSQNEYIYKYVSRDRFCPGRSDARLLDEGTLYAARFNIDDSGQWLPLDIADGNFRAACRKAGVSFADQDEVSINTRLAADVFGVTKMDRPEWGAVNLDNGDVYFTLTNNTSYTVADAAGPRVKDAYGHIIRWREHNRDYAGQRFIQDLFTLADPGEDSRGPDGKPLNQDSILASPGGLWFDPEGRLWIQTDMNGSQLSSGPLGNDQMLVADPHTGELKRFPTGPLGCEAAGIATTPDFRTLFINIQHPGESSIADNLLSTWPDGPGHRPRSATMVITREDGRYLL